MELVVITNDVQRAIYAQKCGVDRIMVDLEKIGKAERQAHRNTLISDHAIADVAALRAVLGKSRLVVRVNPLHGGSKSEIDQAIEFGADVLMLPMFSSAAAVQAFVDIVGGRAKVNLLLETPQAMVRIDDILAVQGIDEIQIGLNDLHLALKLDFMFELLSGGLIDYLAEKISSKGILFGFGGVARLGHGLLDASLVLSEHWRLGSQIVILSRDFQDPSIDLAQEVAQIRAHLASLSTLSAESLRTNSRKLRQRVRDIVGL
jgi:hypothetical protein